MEKDKLTFIEEKKIEKELKEKDSEFQFNLSATNPIKARFAKFHLDKKQIKPDDLI